MNIRNENGVDAGTVGGRVKEGVDFEDRRKLNIIAKRQKPRPKAGQ